MFGVISVSPSRPLMTAPLPNVPVLVKTNHTATPSHMSTVCPPLQEQDQSIRITMAKISTKKFCYPPPNRKTDCNPSPSCNKRFAILQQFSKRVAILQLPAKPGAKLHHLATRVATLHQLFKHVQISAKLNFCHTPNN